MCIRTRSNDNNPFGANSAKAQGGDQHGGDEHEKQTEEVEDTTDLDRKSTRLNSSHRT